MERVNNVFILKLANIPEDCCAQNLDYERLSDGPINVGRAERATNSMISRLFLLLTSIEGCVVIWRILRFPSEAGSARLFGLSTLRLLLLGGALAVVGAALGLLIGSWRKRAWFEGFQNKLIARTENKIVLLIIMGLSILGTLGGLQLTLYASAAEEPVVQAFLYRLEPCFIWISLIGVQVFGVVFFWHISKHSRPNSSKRDLVSVIFFLSILLIAGISLSISGYGFSEETDNTGYFRTLGTPILGIQVFGSVLATFFFIWAGSFFEVFAGNSHRARWFRKDLFVGLIIWMAAFSLWMSVPLTPNWFADPPRPPNYTYSPNSDAHQYDSVAQSLLVGSGYRHQDKDARIRRPMLSTLLALFHTIGGFGYEDIVGWQVALLAFFPAAVYALTRSLHNRASGILASLLIIFRERNSIALADTITVSHAKLLMADLLATLGAVLFFLIILEWLKGPTKRSKYALLAGGVLGFFVMVRSELLVFIFVVALFSVAPLIKKPGLWIKGVTSLAFGFALMVAPWMWRNWEVTGEFYLDKPIGKLPALRKLDEILGSADQLEFQSARALEQIWTFPRQVPKSQKLKIQLNPAPDIEGNVAYKVSFSDNFLNHLSNGLIQSVIFLPLAPRFLVSIANLPSTHHAGDIWSTCCTVDQYVRELPYWWSSWDGGLANQSKISLLIVLIFLSVGLAALWKYHKNALLLLGASVLAYILFFSINSRSGGRWLLEVDWIIVLIYSIGIVEIILGLMRWLGWELPSSWFSVRDEGLEYVPTQIAPHYTLIASVLLFVGASMPIAEMTIPAKYSQAGLESKLTALQPTPPPGLFETDITLTEFMAAADFEAWYGRALYPRFYEAEDGMEGKLDAFKRPYSRIEFYLVGTQNVWVVLPYSGSIPAFPHASDVVVIGCAADQYLDAVLIAVYPPGGDKPQPIFWQENLQDIRDGCSVPTE